MNSNPDSAGDPFELVSTQSRRRRDLLAAYSRSQSSSAAGEIEGLGTGSSGTPYIFYGRTGEG